MDPRFLAKLDAYFSGNSYLGSVAQVTLEDYKWCTQFTPSSIDARSTPHLARWHSHVCHLMSRSRSAIPDGEMPVELQCLCATEPQDPHHAVHAEKESHGAHVIEDRSVERQRTTACTAVLDAAGIEYIRVPVDPLDGHHQDIDPTTGKTYTRIADHVRKDAQLSFSSLMKSMVFEYGEDAPLMVLMTKEYKIDPKKVAALVSSRLGKKISQNKVKMMKEEDAIKFTGFQFGGTTAIGIANKMIVIAQEDIQTEEDVFINGGSKAFLVGLSRRALESVVEMEYADVAKR